MKDKLLVAGEKGKAEDKINGKSNCKESCNKSKTKFKTDVRPKQVRQRR